MKVTIIHGQSHKGSTYHISKILADKIGGEVKEFFLPRDFGEFCIGCTQCFRKSETLCPHYEKINPLTEALDEADVLIFESPVYVYHVTGSMKAFLDHYGYRWMLHRPEESMFHKQAVCISTAAGAGMKSTNKDMADSFFYWGVPKVYKYGVRVMATSYKDIKPKIKAKIEKDTSKMAYQIKKNAGHVKTGIKTKICFYFMRMLHTRGWDEADLAYWSKKRLGSRKKTLEEQQRSVKLNEIKEINNICNVGSCSGYFIIIFNPDRTEQMLSYPTFMQRAGCSVSRPCIWSFYGILHSTDQKSTRNRKPACVPWKYGWGICQCYDF